ncbi:MAG: M28 family peptidase, partial [Calditrichaeota bacterium]
TVAMINLDMISRNEDNDVTIIGTRHSPQIRAINRAANRYVGLHLNYDGEQYFDRSDQANFARHRIPVIFYNTDGHPDYHRPSDTADKIKPGKLARVARLAFLVAWELANAESRPSYQDHADAPNR